MYRIATQYSGTKVSLGFPPSSSLTQGILQINHHVNPLAWELWAVGMQKGGAEMGLGNRRKPCMRNEGWIHRWAAHRQEGSSRERRGLISDRWEQEWSGQNNVRWTGSEREGSGQWERERRTWLLKKTRKRKLCSSYGWWWEVTLQDLIGALQTYKSVCFQDKRPTASHSRDLCQTCLVISFHVALSLTVRLVDTAPRYRSDEDNSRPTTFGPQLWVLLHWFAGLGSERQEFLTFHLYWNSLPSLVCGCVCVCVCVCLNNMMLCRNIMCLFCCYSVAESCPTLCDPLNCTAPGFSVLHYLPEFAQIHVHWISDAI